MLHHLSASSRNEALGKPLNFKLSLLKSGKIKHKIKHKKANISYPVQEEYSMQGKGMLAFLLQIVSSLQLG